MTMEIDRPRWTELEQKWAMQQLVGSGLVKQEGEDVGLTKRGIDRCLSLEKQLGIQDNILLWLFYALLEQINAPEEQGISQEMNMQGGK